LSQLIVPRKQKEEFVLYLIISLLKQSDFQKKTQ